MLRSPLLFVAPKNLIYIYVLRKRDKKYAYTMSQKNFPKEQKKLKSRCQTKHIFFKFKYNFHPIDRNKQSLKRAKWVPRGGPPGPAKSGAHHHSPPRVRPPTNAPEPPHPVIPLVPATPISPRKKKKEILRNK